MLSASYELPVLPPAVDLETVRILKALNRASRALADLKGQAKTIPNQGILIDTLALQEAKASSEIENIVTTQDELFQADLFPDDPQSPAAKEVALYRDALRLGYARLLQTDGLIVTLQGNPVLQGGKELESARKRAVARHTAELLKGEHHHRTPQSRTATTRPHFDNGLTLPVERIATFDWTLP